MIHWTCYIMMLVAILLGFIRLIRGPSSLDRIVAFDLIAIAVIGVVILFSMQQQSSYYIEMILIFCLLGFATTIAFMEILFRRFKKDE